MYLIVFKSIIKAKHNVNEDKAHTYTNMFLFNDNAYPVLAKVEIISM